MKVIKIFTDGGYRKKSLVGAYSYVIYVDEVLVVDIGVAIADTSVGVKVTNNTMELNGVMKALEWLDTNGYKAKDYVVYIWTDSQYVQLGLTDWIHNWKRNGWKNASRKPVLNKVLWMQLDNLYAKVCKNYKAVNVHWVEGHSGHPGNDRADYLCNKVMDNYVINVKYEVIKSSK